ncbi:hypothetical protein LTR67_001497 [Exophiala xenobiotica]
MKFGDTLYQRSVPKWVAYNVKYNEIKHLIKTRTSAGVAVPVGIPVQGKSKWEELENELFRLLEAEYDNVTLFLRSKQGEIERRLAYLEKQIRLARRAVQDNALDKPIMQARKYRQLMRDIEEIGDEVLNLSRFAAVQKTAFRKILKKYRKWTGSTVLQTRLDVEVFSSKKLQTDFSDYLQQLSEERAILTEELAGPMLTGRPREPSPASERQQKRTSASAKRLPITKLNEAILRGPLAFDAALMTVPYGEAAGSAVYWVHQDNLDAARALLLRHMRDSSTPSTPPRKSSLDSVSIRSKSASSSNSRALLTHMLVFDNAQRYVKDYSTSRPSRIALSGHWSSGPEAVVTLAGLAPTSSDSTMLTLNRKDLALALQRDAPVSNASENVIAIQRYLREHRDIKPLAETCFIRNRYLGHTNTADVGNWATLDSNITVTAVDMAQVGVSQSHSQAGDAFPYSVLHIRWEFARTPTVVRAFDESHLVERVHEFSLEDMAIHTAQKDLPVPSWQSLLEKDIRKVPIAPYMSRAGVTSRTRLHSTDVTGSSSGPSSSDGPQGSIFSAGTVGNTSVTSESAGPSSAGPSKISTTPAKTRRKKRARIKLPERSPSPARYWNEFDDGDSDGNPEQGYVIYVDPDESAFPGAESIAKAFGSVYDSFSKGKSRIISLLTLEGQSTTGERAPLLSGENSADEDPDTSSSETDEFSPRTPTSRRRSRRSGPPGSFYRPHQILTPRQKALEQTLFSFYTGLIAVCYILLVMSGILLATGRRKAYFEVDAGVLGGVVSAETCAVAAMILIMMRKQRISVVHWGLVAVLVASAVLIGVALLTLMFGAGHPSRDHKGSAGSGNA